jgi:large subunit ribosomal protein L13
MLKTFSPKPSQIEHDWYLVDAAGKTLGRLATVIATRLQGKHKPTFAPHLDCGDNIIVINASKVAVTGQKLTSKKYYRHTGYPGGIRERTLQEQLTLDPTKVIHDAVAGMLPKNRLQASRLLRLRVHAGPTHDHEAQKPVRLEIK